MTWTRFKDLYRDGSRKLGWEYIYVNQPAPQAIAYFRRRFDRDPLQTGETWYDCDYGIREYPTLGNAAAANVPHYTDETTSSHLNRPDVLVVDDPDAESA